MTPCTTLRDEHRRSVAKLVEQFDATRASTRGVEHFLSGLAHVTDHTLTCLWQQSGMPTGSVLAAVGGYGRGELFPYSDVDVLILLPESVDLDTDALAKNAVETFIGSCWDIGLAIGSSVRTIRECMQESHGDITVQTALLEARFITGQRSLFGAFEAAYWAQMDSRAFILAKLREMRQRHHKYEDTPYSLEPNCKESPGGLRDLQVIMWIAQAAHLGSTWHDLELKGLATPLEVRQLRRNEATLKLIRARLHLVAHRREDRLVFDLQEQLASTFGFAGDGVKRASEELMHRYYWAAKAVTQINQILLLNIEEHLTANQDAPTRRIDRDFIDRAGKLDIASEDIYLKDPHQILRTFLVFAQEPGINTFSPRTFRALYNARDLMNGAFRKDPVNAATFLAILKSPQGVTHAFRLMNHTSVLGRYLWVFRRIVGQMQHDLFHVYTVDQHILMVLRNVRRFFIPEHAHEYPLCSEIAAGFDEPWVLYAAALFHDIAKGRGGDHSRLGASEVQRFAQTHGVNDADAHFIEFLVAEHLTMSHIAQKEDLGDPAVINSFARLVGDERHLNGLYLLTVADIRGTSPKVWNNWKGRLLEDLYRATLSALGGHMPDPDAIVESRQRAAIALMTAAGLPHGCQTALWKTMDVSYFMRHDPEDIAWHASLLWNRVASPEPVVRARIAPHGEGMQALVYAPDHADMFARISGYFEASELSIVDAKIHTTRPDKAGGGWALDTFLLVAPEPVTQYRELIPEVQAGLIRSLQEQSPLSENRHTRRISRRVRYFPMEPRVEIQPDERGQRWILNVSSSDRVGLLYTIARVLARHRVNLELAKITTLGERVEDTFLVTGPELTDTRKQAVIETEIVEALREPVTG